MSPRADVREEGEGGSYQDHKGEFVVEFKDIAEKTMKPKDSDSPFKESLRVTFTIKGAEDTVSLGVSIEDPAADLLGFVPDPTEAPVNNEVALRQFIETNAYREPLTVYVGGFIRSRLALEGIHTFTRITNIIQYNRKSDGQVRLIMVATTNDGLTVSWNCPEPQFKREKQEVPDDDYIGPLSADAYAFQYLQMFGLDWGRMTNEDLRTAEAYWPGHYDKDGEPITPLFPDRANPWRGFLDITARHGWKPVKMEIERHKQYGLGPKRIAKGLVKMVEVDSADNAEFEREKLVFLELWDNLTKVILNKDTDRFMAAGKLTDEGRTIALHILVPLLNRWPEGILKTKEDGTPAVHLPPTADTWNPNALVAACKTAEAIMGMDEEDRFLHVSLTDGGKNIVGWAEKNLADWWDGSGHTENEAEVL